MVLSQQNKSSDVRKVVAYGDFVWRGLPCRTEPAGLYKYSPFGEVTIRNGGRSGRQNRFLLTFGEVVKSRESSGDSIARRYYVKDYLGNVRAVVEGKDKYIVERIAEGEQMYNPAGSTRRGDKEKNNVAVGDH